MMIETIFNKLNKRRGLFSLRTYDGHNNRTSKQPSTCSLSTCSLARGDWFCLLIYGLLENMRKAKAKRNLAEERGYRERSALKSLHSNHLFQG